MSDDEALIEFKRIGSAISYCHADDSCGDWRYAPSLKHDMLKLEGEYPNLANEFARLKATSGWLL